jgi:hypothetical protein
MRNIGFASCFAIAAVMAAPPVLAQETTAGIRGMVTAAGQPVAGATVKVVHVPSGTTSSATTKADGSFSAVGLRAGGPFSITVTMADRPEYVLDGIQLVAGEPMSLPIEVEGNDIVVTGTHKQTAQVMPGPMTTMDRQQIEGVASVSRDLRDIVRRDPMATMDPSQNRGVVIAGQIPRSNRFSIDGLALSDSYGLNTGGLPTARGPVPLDAIEQLTVKVAPFDVTEGNVQGGAVNIILRSGTNDYHGSGFYTYTSDALTGSRTSPGLSNPTGKVDLDFSSKTYGGSLSGPIIKDKLFVAFSYERLEQGQPVATGIAGFANVVPNLTESQISQIQGIAQNAYGYDTLGVQQTLQETDEKWTLKGDWNITSGQRLSATWIHNSSSLGSVASVASTSATSPSLPLQSANTNRTESIDSYVVQLNSDWSDRFHTEVRAFYRDYDQTNIPYGELGFGYMQVCLDPDSATQLDGAANTNSTLCSQGSTAAPGAARLYFGPSVNPAVQFVRNKQYGAEAVVRWEYNDFSMKLIGGWRHSTIDNAFMSNSTGTYYFDSVQDFVDHRAGSLSLTAPISGLYEDSLYGFEYDQYSAGGQVTWTPSPRFNITAASRVDMFGGIEPPKLNPYFTERYGFSNRSVMNGKYAVQPRLSFTWKPTQDLTLRGGAGLFAGGTPDIFVGNSYSVTGVLQNAITISRNINGVGCQGGVSAEVCSAALDNVSGSSIDPRVLAYLQTNLGALSAANVNALDRNFKIQSSWKYSLSADYAPEFDNFLGSGWNIGADFYYGKTHNAPLSTDIRLVQVGTTPDGRPRYASIIPSSPNVDLLIGNTSKGHSLVAVARVDKEFRDLGLTAGVSYTFQDIKDVSSLAGTTGANMYSQSAMLDPNVAAYGTSNYQIRNTIKFRLDWEHAFFGDNKTRFSLFGESRSGLPYSLTMNDAVQTLSHGQVFGVTGVQNRFLLYVPDVSSMTADSRVSYDSAATYEALAAFVKENGLKQGSIVRKNSMRSPSWTKIDLHIDQEVPVPLTGGAGKFKLFADIENVLNLIDKDWGALKQVNSPQFASIVNVACATMVGTNCTQYRYSNFAKPAVDNQSRISLWGIRIGARIDF